MLKLLTGMFFLLNVFYNCIGQIDSVNNNDIKGFDFEKVNFRLLSININDKSDIQIDTANKLRSECHTTIPDVVIKDLKNTHGQITTGYSYGLNTIFSDTSKGITSIFNTTGTLQTGIVGLPVQVSFNYSTLRVPLGANNYFRVTFDKQRYLDQQKEKLEQKIESIENIEQRIEQKKSSLSGIQGYTEVYLDMLKKRIERERSQLAKSAKERLRDSIQGVQDSVSSNYSVDQRDSLTAKSEAYLNRLEKLQKEYDSISGIYSQIISVKSKCDSLISSYGTYKNKLLAYEAQLKGSSASQLDTLLPGMNSGLAGFVKSIRKIDIGLTYPKTTALSTQSTAIKGIGTEFQYRNYYIAFSSGITLNNVMLSTNEITNKLNYSQNAFNQFDFQQVLGNGLLTTLKAGYGKPEATHVFLGMNYLTNTRFLQTSSDTSVYDPAASLELDIRYVPDFIKGGILDLVYGKTSANRQLDTLNQSGVFESLFSGYRSHTFMAKYTQDVPVWRSSFSVQCRSIDAYANTTVYGMMQPGNRRVAFESRHKISSFLKLGTNLRMDEAYGTDRKFRLYTTGLNASGSWTDYFSYTAMFNKVQYTSSQSLSTTEGDSYLAGVSLNSAYKIQSLSALSGFTYNDYLFSDSAGISKYTQVGVSESIGTKKWALTLKYDYFFKSVYGIKTGTSLWGTGLKYTFRQLKIDAALSLAKETALPVSIGGHLEVRWQATNFMDLSLRGERFVLGSFYRNYYQSLYDRFPYLFSVQTSFKL